MAIWLMIALIYYLWDDSSGWRDGQWYIEFFLFTQVTVAILTPIFLMAITIAILGAERKEEKETNDLYMYDRRFAQRVKHPNRGLVREPQEPRREPEIRRVAPETRRVEARPPPEPRPRPRPRPAPAYDHIPEYEPSIYDDEIQCPACRRWISTDMPSCAFCRTKVGNFNRVRQVQKQYRSGQINKIQYDRAMKNLKG
ncbi:MAG: hypothetical protein AYK23_05785 [Candidatus Proteinoplasmatales archaeon SG8-5]|nr:MAG: hypothetical protein AYK23_05785 [Candidatus Proteinoplasmatales archaeon SG8-5]